MSSLANGKRSVEVEYESEDNVRHKRKSYINCAQCCNKPKDAAFGACNLQLCGQSKEVLIIHDR